MGAYSSELITPEWKRISERLKRLSMEPQDSALQDVRSTLTFGPRT